MNFLRNFWRWMRTDGLLHAETCLLIVLLVSLFLMLFCHKGVALCIAVTASVVAAFGKEIYDYKSGKGTAEWHDIICDFFGIVIGFLTIVLL